MAKANSDIQKHMPKKRTGTALVPYIILAVIMIIAGVWFGYIVDVTKTDDGEADVMAAVDAIDDYTNIETFTSAVKSAVTDENGYARQGAMICGIAGFIVFAYFASKPNKRYHRKGEEHGSARWGDDKEKKIIQDTEDFYNNVIAASDVLLVLDRKKRDLNAMTDKQRKAAEKKAESEKKAEEKRIAAIRAEIAAMKGK